MIGKRLAERYELMELLGRGASSSVYCASDTLLDRRVAIKLYTAGALETGTGQTLREARTLAALSHPHLVTVFDAGHDDDRPYVVMEFASGGTLAALLDAEKTLSPAAALTWMLPVLSAAAYLHAQGVVHRDLKPQNIVLDTASRTCKVVDLGIAKQLADPSDSGLASGTPHFMSPEEARGAVVTSASDVWSLGVCLFRALTGAFPFSGSTACEVVADVVHRSAPSILSVKPDLPIRLAAVIDRALSRSVTYRFANAEQLAHALVLAATLESIDLPSAVQGLPDYVSWRHEAVTCKTAEMELMAGAGPALPALSPARPAATAIRTSRVVWASVALLAAPVLISLLAGTHVEPIETDAELPEADVAKTEASARPGAPAALYHFTEHRTNSTPSARAAAALPAVHEAALVPAPAVAPARTLKRRVRPSAVAAPPTNEAERVPLAGWNW